jgi:putative endonuclease
LVTGEAIAQAMRSYIEESNRLNHQRRATRGGDVLRLEKARKAIDGIVSAIEDGGYTRPLMERLKGLEAEVEALEAKLTEPMIDMPDLHPNMAELYRRKVERLSEALSQPEERNEAAQALRALIKEIILTPGPNRGQVFAELRSEFETVLQWAQDDGGQRFSAVGRFLGGPLAVPEDSRAGMTGVFGYGGGILFRYCSLAMGGSGMVPREAWIAVYMMADRYRGTLYTGVTGHFINRVTQHRDGQGSGFARRYGLTRLVWYEEHDLMTEAIQRETSIKRWPRQWKINLIERDNPRWCDLYAAVFAWTPVPRQI